MRILRRMLDGVGDARQIAAPDREISPGERWRHFLAHGDFSLAYAAATETYLKSFGDARGFIAYGQKSGHTFALGDPLSEAADAAGLLADFVATFRDPVFVAVDGATATLLAARGYRINAFGADAVVDLAGHTFAGGQGKAIRYATSWAAANGFTLAERAIGAFDREAIAGIDRRWRGTRVNSRRELLFLNRRFTIGEEPGVRRFFALDAQGRPVAFISFDPLSRDGRTTGYLASTKRREPEGSTYLDLALMRHAIDVFRGEGLETCRLGLSPLAGLQPSPWPDDRAVRLVLARAGRSAWVNRRVFNFEGLAAYKARFRGRELPHFLALPPDGRNVLRLVSMLRLMRLV